MKKTLYMLFAACFMMLASCSKDEPGGTATQELAGQWWVTCDVLTPDGEMLVEDYYSYLCLTYNTSANVPDEFIVSDMGNFWDYNIPVKCNIGSGSFGNDDWRDCTILYKGEPYTYQVLINNGKIVPGAALTPSGMPADSIEFDVQFSNDGDGLIWHMRGYRYTGFVADDE